MAGEISRFKRPKTRTWSKVLRRSHLVISKLYGHFQPDTDCYKWGYLPNSRIAPKTCWPRKTICKNKNHSFYKIVIVTCLWEKNCFTYRKRSCLETSLSLWYRVNYQVTKDLLDDIAKTELYTALMACNHLLQIQRSAHVGGTYKRSCWDLFCLWSPTWRQLPAVWKHWKIYWRTCSMNSEYIKGYCNTEKYPDLSLFHSYTWAYHTD